jgi:type IV pilus assembly protein PilB
METDSLLTFLSEQGQLTPDQVQEVSEEHQRSGKPIPEVLYDFGIFDEMSLYQTLANLLVVPFVDLNSIEFRPDILSQIDPQTIRLQEALPINYDSGSITIVLTDPLNTQIRDDLRFATNKEINIAVAPPSQIREKLQSYFGHVSVSAADLVQEIAPDIAKGDLEQAANAAPIVKFVNTVLMQAIQARASDIHFEPFENEFKIRYRVDGALYEMTPPPKSLALSVTSRIKVMSALNIAERRVPQDGRIQTSMAGRNVDLRVSTLPTQFGESVVLRVLDRSTVNLSLETLGMPKKIYDYICNIIEKPNGIFIVTGPTGSGKTTTLYSCLNRINTIDSKLLTVEDPVEYDIEGIQQIPVNEGIGLTFARVLRAFLRQDPDRIMVGETRDVETATIAIQASLTGHLVLTSLHTNDAPGAVTRLIDMGVEPYLISSSLEGILAQRLIRKICPECRTPYEPDEATLNTINLSPHDVGDRVFYYGRGCPSCNGTGYKGRKGIYELLDVTDPIRELINERSPSIVIRQKAIELGMQTLREDGLRCIFDGETTIEEVVKYT